MDREECGWLHAAHPWRCRQQLHPKAYWWVSSPYLKETDTQFRAGAVACIREHEGMGYVLEVWRPGVFGPSCAPATESLGELGQVTVSLWVLATLPAKS